MDSGLSRLFYRETVEDSGVGDEKVMRRNVYAHVRVTVSAQIRGKGAMFSWNAGDNIPARFAPAVAQGIQDAMNTGILAGLEVIDVHASIENGSYHDVDSNADVFREAAEKAMAEALRQAHPVILEAIALVTVAVPGELISIAEKIVLAHGGSMNPPRSGSAAPSVVASLPAARVQALMAELLEATGGRANITSTIGGFRPRPQPPDINEQWIAVT